MSMYKDFRINFFMKKIIALMMTLVVVGWSIPKPMESITNYNVMLIHGAYGSKKGFSADTSLPEAYNAGGALENGATLGGYTNDERITQWLSSEIFEEAGWKDNKEYVHNSYVFNWRSFSKPANSSVNNARELGYRQWNSDGTYGKRRALIEEAQEVKAKFTVDKNDPTKDLHGQVALDSIRQYPDLYRQIASRYILIGHSMGGVVSREYVQNSDYYHGDVDKIITLDSPHEGTGALNMQLDLVNIRRAAMEGITESMLMMTGVGLAAYLNGKDLKTVEIGVLGLAISMGLSDINSVSGKLISEFFLEKYNKTDSLVCYVDPHADENDDCTFYPNITALKSLYNPPDSLPMFRLLAGEHSMTFTDPKLGYKKLMSFFVPDALTAPFANMASQWTSGFPMNVDGIGSFFTETRRSLSTSYVNAITGFVSGLVAGVHVREQGSALVETNGGLGYGTTMLTHPEMDVKRFRFNAAYNASEAALSHIAEGLFVVGAAALALDYFGSFGKTAKTVLGITAAVGLGSSVAVSITSGFLDLGNSHMFPLYKEHLETWRKEEKNTYTRIAANDEGKSLKDLFVESDEERPLKPYIMEDFLYEKPFVNLALNDSRTMDSLARNSSASLNPNCYFESDSLQNAPLCEIGLYGTRDSVRIKDSVVTVGSVSKPVYNSVNDKGDSVFADTLHIYGTFEQRKYSDFRNSPLKFKSESDWYKVGVKVDRWERVDGLKPNGEPAPKGVPIRHVERYSVPDIVATGFIEKYSFVVDDLMPHRMRQIKMTFNSNEEVAWECDISKAEDDPHACAVYKRHVGGSWGKPVASIGDKGYVPHPIKKNGRFDFNARDYFGNLADIQKDNQNTVVISMVNKIGLSNTQRFYYLFKATANMLKPTWPQHDVVLNEVDGFGVYVSALDYQGFRVRSAKDGIFSDPLGTPTQVGDSLPMVMTLDSSGSSAVFASKQKISAPAEGAYRWVVDAVVNNNEKDSSKTDSYEVHFKVDRTAPAFTLTSDAMMNPDSSMFITRFKWAGGNPTEIAKGSDIRVMRWTLEKATGQPSGGSHATFTKYAELPALYDVASNEFAIAWDKVPQGKRDSMGNGLYRIAAYAIDYAVPNLDAYHKVNALVDSIFFNPTNLSDSLWNRIDSLALNDTIIYAEFRVDTAAPVFTFRETRTVTAADTVNYGTYVNLSGKYDALRNNAPPRESDWTYVSKDSLLQIGYTVMDTLNGLDSAAVTIGWNFVHIPDTNVIDRAGDSVWVFDSLGGSTSGTWTEMAGLRMADGEYSVRAILRDEAKNIRQDIVPKRVRVDRTAPQIIGLTSNHLVYMATDGDFSATILVSERGDVGVNRTGMHCSYRVLGGADSSWHEIRKGERKLLANDTMNFTIAKTSVDTARGTRYLEAACVDAAGNVSVRTDLFHVGARFPQITYPQADSVQSEQSFIPIVGIAPKTSSADSLSSVYRLRYRVGNDTAWRTDKVKVVAANRSTSADNVSRISQSTEGVLGYLENDGFGDEAKITVELAIASCETCDDWAATTTNFVVIPPDTNYSKPAVEFAITRNGSDVTTFKTGDGPVDISVRLKNKFNGNYMLRVYAEDSKHRGIFDASSEKVFYNPYYGTPTAAADTAIWFYEKDGKYHLAWKNLDKVNLKVGYNSAKFGESCVDSTGNTATGCSTEHAPVNFSAVLDAAKAYLADYPEWMPPAYIDSAMTISDGSGEVVLESSDAFRVYVERKDPQDTSTLNVPVYFGESAKPGFYWVEHVDSLVSPLMTGWTVNPNAYGLDYRWNGIATSGAYPSGDITLYAEVTENILDNPFVNVVTKTLKVEQKEVELVVPKSLPDYIALKVVDPNMVVVDDSNKVAYMRDSMKVFFGLKNGDAHVKISVLDSSKKPFRTLLDSILRAHSGDSAYFATWDGKDSLGNVQSVGTYYIKFESPSNAFKTKTVPFEMKLRNGLLDETPKDPKTSNLGFYVAEAKKVADDVYRYEPYADYLVLANMSGWYLPDSLRNRTYNVNGTVSGTQKILGFRPEHFSLAIKRHRDTLEMVILRLVHSCTRIYDCELGWELGGCRYKGSAHDDIKLDTVKFWENKRFFEGTDSIHYKYAGFYHPFYVQNGAAIRTDSNYIDMIACSMKSWSEFNKNRIGRIKTTRSEFDSLKSLCEWRLEDLIGRSGYLLEIPSLDTNSRGPQEIKLLSDGLSDSCTVDSTSGYLDSVCTLDNGKYNPNKKLFNVRLVTPQSGCFFTHFGPISGSIDTYHWQNIHYEFHFEIPYSYWNAPFGMDNLVNRTIRFDHTNQTIFNKNYDDGYWNFVRGNGKNMWTPVNPFIGNYYDGSEWRFNQKYGLLTPFEVQRLIFYPVDVYADGSNVFRFDDEGLIEDSVALGYSSSFELKFYGKDDTTHHFVAKVIGDLADLSSNSGCEVDTTKFVMQIGAKNPCQIKLSSTAHETVKTPTFTHGNVHFFVGMNQTWAQADNGHRPSVAYPAANMVSWRETLNDACSDSMTWDDYKNLAAKGKEDKACYKYYGSGSRVHFYFNDYGNNDSLWKVFFLTDTTHYIRNMVNSPDNYSKPNYVDGLMLFNKITHNGNDFSLSYNINSENYERVGESDSLRFFIPLDSLKKIKEEYAGAGIDIQRIKVDSVALDTNAVYDSSAMRLYVNAQHWKDTVFYRRSYDSTKTVLERPGDTISLRDIYVYRANPDANSCSKALYCVTDFEHPQSLNRNPWIKEPIVDSSSILQIDFSEHPFLEISGNRDSLDRHVVFKGVIPPRPPEIVEIRGRLNSDQTYSLSYLNNSTYYSITDTLRVAPNCPKYMDGSCHLAWFNVNKLQGHTQFLLTWNGDGNAASVNPTNAMHFNMYVGSNVKPENNGVVKSMYGELSVLFPQGSLDKAEDFTVRTVNVQRDYGFGVFKDMALTGPVMEVLPSMTFSDTNNLPRIQMRISRQEMENMLVTPQTLRLYKVDFENKRFVPLEDALYGFLYADGSAVKNKAGNAPLECNGKTDVDVRCSGGNFAWDYVLISAQTRTFSVFVAMDSLSAVFPDSIQEELPAQFVCHVPSDSLWMGIDNGYLAYGATCNHPGQGTLSLYRDNSLVAEVQGEISDTIKYNGKRLVGGSVVGTVAPGRYESRYVGRSVLGLDVQLAGPAVRTDAARPVISAFEVLGGEDVLDRVFTVRANVKDVESGVARVVVSSTLGNDPRAPIELVPDSLGNVTGVIRLTRSELAKCSGCKFSLEMRAEDFGHNHTERAYESGKLYQYPTELALWYPSREGTGNIAHEYVGTGHDLSLGAVTSPWMGDAGIYFSEPTDHAVGVGPNAGRVNLGTSNSYSFETRIKVGYSGDAGWHRVLGFNGVGGLEMELLVSGRKLRLREGSRTWETLDNALPVAKEWAHVVVTVDSSEVNFYVNGEIVKSAVAEPLDRELEGVFSAGAGYENSFVGHVADMRMYKKSLSGGEVFALSQPVVDDKVAEPEIVKIVTVPMVTVDGGNGFEPEFSCAVAGNRYFESTRDNAKLTLDALIEKAATYKVMVYVRSAVQSSANVAVLPSPGVRYSGHLPLSSVWRTAMVSDISMNLSAGMHTITFEAPEGVQIAGFALVTANVSPASIAWNAGLENPERKVKTFVRYEGFNNKKILQPRVRLKNISNAPVNGYSVRYYFRGEESSLTRPHAYFPYDDTTGLAVHSESDRTGYVEWKFKNGRIPVGGMVFNGDGPHFGVHYEDWTFWNPYDDPSFVENATHDFVEDDGIIVLDSEKRLIGGSCVEMEDSVSVEVRARVYAAETRNDNSASEFQIKVENVGNVTLKNYDVRYYFFLEGGLAPEFNTYNLPDGVSATMENFGEGRWQVSMHASEPLASGASWKKIAQIVLHCENWNNIWDASDDPSRIGLRRDMVEAVGVNVFDSLGNRIYGNEPVWPEIAHVATPADSSGVPDYGLNPKDDGVPIHRTDDGLVIELTQYTNISLSLVNVVGAPIKSLYSGTLAPGAQFVRVDWTGIDMNRTYLLLRVNGLIRSTKLLSLL